jgi:NAD(P)-dependent dehydrogenase (short-subunit alcohol dehydrogenase family)
MVNFGLSGRVVMVTGGGSGIGRATALLAAAEGARVAILDSNADAAEAVAAEVSGIAVVLDVRDGSAVRAAVARTERELGPVDGLVAAAGISRAEPAETMPEEVWQDVIGTNLTGAFLCAQAVGGGMIERRRGAIVTVASSDAFGGHAGRAHYCASKFGLIGLTRTLAIEWGRHGVRVNAVAPGAVDTPLLHRGVPADQIEQVLRDRTPLARLASAEDQARASLFLLSDAAAYVTGAMLPVDGGLTSGFFTRWNGADYASTALLQRGIYEAPTGYRPS